LTFDHILEGHGAAIRRMVVTNDADSGPELWSSGEDGIIRVWSCANITAAPKLLEDHKHPIHTMVVSGSTVWSAGWETRIRVWSQKVSEFVFLAIIDFSLCLTTDQIVIETFGSTAYGFH
jgi:WD40 repeat protein